VLGWYMVKSGMVDRPDVSQYRLTAHLGAAFIIYILMLWVALGLLFPRPQAGTPGGRLRAGSWVLALLIVVTALSGGLVAGLDAGFAYNTFPLMDGRLIPQGLLSFEPALRNITENIVTVQFQHRVLAITAFCLAMAVWYSAWRSPLAGRARLAFHCLGVTALLQVVLGVLTLVLVMPVPLAASHQAGALVLLSAAVWVVHEMRSSPRTAEP